MLLGLSSGKPAKIQHKNIRDVDITTSAFTLGHASIPVLENSSHWEQYAYTTATEKCAIQRKIRNTIVIYSTPPVRFKHMDIHTKSAVPCEWGQHTNGTRDAKEHRVVVHLCESIMLQQHSAVGIHIGPWVLRLAVLKQYIRHQLHTDQRKSAQNHDVQPVTMLPHFALNGHST